MSAIHDIDKNVSVIIPVYNRREKVLRALESVRSQTRFHDILEIFVIDDGSTDGTDEAVIQYQNEHPEMPIKLIRQANSGPSIARNLGMANASGYYLAFLDSDDEWLEDKLALQLELMEDHPEIDFLGGGTDDAPLTILGKKKPLLYRATLKDLLIKSFPVTPSIIMKKEIYDNIGGFDPAISYYEDCDYLQQICIAGYGYYYYAKKVVICDRGKSSFGESGLSKNLGKIHVDCIKSLQKRKREKSVTLFQYFLLYGFYTLKHLRRVVISRTH